MRTVSFVDQRRVGFVSCVVPMLVFSTSVSRCFLVPAHVVSVNVLPYCGFVLELRCLFGVYGYSSS